MPGINLQRSLLGLLAAGLFLAATNEAGAAERNRYRRPPFQVFSSQMPDALLGDRFEKPVWSLHSALKLPAWLAISVEQRTRYETRGGDYRAGTRGGDQQIALQNGMWLQATRGAFRVATEFLDARALLADEGSLVNNTHANTADFLQGYLAWADQDLFDSGIGAEVVAGRQTLNLGGRRLVARNVYRNTVNNFTGGKLRLLEAGLWELNAFATRPVRRLPNDSADILADVHRFDEEAARTVFSGAFLQWHGFDHDLELEIYLYHLDEDDAANDPTRNRRLFTPGLRLFRPPAPGRFDFAWEPIGQFGTVRETARAADRRDLDHRAWHQHIDVGYTFDVPWSPRLAVVHDYASGDENPGDRSSERFDTLFGARRWEYGPTGIFGLIPRSNINSPGYQIQVAPRPDVLAGVFHRAVWLASDTDSWTTADLRDRTGNTGSFVGQQLELMVRWDVNSSLNLETGGAFFFKGRFAREARRAPDPRDVSYFYFQSMLRF